MMRNKHEMMVISRTREEKRKTSRVVDIPFVCTGVSSSVVVLHVSVLGVCSVVDSSIVVCCDVDSSVAFAVVCIGVLLVVSVCVDVDLVIVLSVCIGVLEHEVFVYSCLSERGISGVLVESLFCLHLHVVGVSVESLSILNEVVLLESVRVQPLVFEVLSIE